LLIAWNSSFAISNTNFLDSGVMLEGEAKDLGKVFKILNLYGPYVDRRTYWDSLIDQGVLREDNLILDGDLNLTLSPREVWGDLTRQDPLVDYFVHVFEESNIVDIELVLVAPTWRNGRSGVSGVSKCLDRFLLVEQLVEEFE
jgi:hypothetical protein